MYYRGRTSFVEMMNMPLSTINALYVIARDRQKAEQAEKEKRQAQGQDPGMSPTEAMMVEDQLEEAFLG